MEDLKSTALTLLNMGQVNILYKIKSLENYKAEAKELLESTESKRNKKDIQNYIDWLDRQINNLKNNGTNIVQ